MFKKEVCFHAFAGWSALCAAYLYSVDESTNDVSFCSIHCPEEFSKVCMVCLSLGESKSHWLPKFVSYTVQFHIEERRRRVALQEIEDLFPKEVCCHVVVF